MIEIPGPNPGWELRELPDYEGEPEYEARQEPPYEWGDRLIDLADYKRERLDGSKEHNLFEGVIVTETGNELKFRVPRRLIETERHGLWALNVFGSRRWFKEHDDYGDLRFTYEGTALWLPHMYPFEEIGEDNLPLIRDRERLNIMITMTKILEKDDPYPLSVNVDTMYGRFSSENNDEFANPYGISYFTEFTYEGVLVVAHEVTWPTIEVPRPSYFDFMEELIEHGEIERFHRIRKGEERAPSQYYEIDKPIDHTQRQRVNIGGSAFGEMWVPVDVLRSGNVQAKISFPNFQ